MSKRSQADRLAEALKSNISGMTARGNEAAKQGDQEFVRTTLSAPRQTIFELKQLALMDGCHMNTLFLIAIQDFLRTVGRECEITIEGAVRARIDARRRAAWPHADQKRSGGDPGEFTQ